ncbi:MAG: PilT/PilU family type 4a pilus ATPase [Candidatus Riflebacteria bacterium]|nr:PilT/PilU family type 4a pilus ATPase [Candidatus Riflebacteria bacterium]
MRVIEKNKEFIDKALTVISANEFFKTLNKTQRESIVNKVGVFEEYEDGEYIVRLGESADSLLIIIEGIVSVLIGDSEEHFEISRLEESQMIGEMALVLNENRTASCISLGKTQVLKLSKEVFKKIISAIPEACFSMMQLLAHRLKRSSKMPVLSDYCSLTQLPDAETLRLLPVSFIQRHRVVPLKKNKNNVTIGYCDVFDKPLLDSVRRFIPGVILNPARIEFDYFNQILKCYGGELAVSDKAESDKRSASIDELLKRLVEEGGSDLHISAQQIPRWRIDGLMREISGFGKIKTDEVLRLIEHMISPAISEQFNETGDADFAYSMDEHSRFRINLLRDRNGVSAVFRHISNNIMSLEELGMPDILRVWAEHPKGLILVTGPTGSGKSTTLAAMIDHINRVKNCHILTIEDPIEYVHVSKSSLVNQREVNVHTSSFSRALKAALREDPDVVLVGEMRDLETVSMALETANTGHLVLATLHTSTAINTVNRIIEQFPSDSQEQIRKSLCDNLIGVCCQRLCRKVGGGRVPAYEIMNMDYGMSNLIREGKTHMLETAMTTSQGKGNRLFNDSLIKLVKFGKITKQEALSQTSDTEDLIRKFSSM